MMRIACALIAVVLLTGCQTIKIAATKKIQPVSGDKGVIEYLSSPYEISKTKVPSSYLAAAEKLCTYRDAPDRPTKPAGAFGVEIWAPVIAKLAFDAGADWLADYVARIKKKSSSNYSARLKINADNFLPGRCLMIGRFADEPSFKKELDSLVIVKIHKEKDDDEVIYLRPVFAWAKNSIALTKCTKNCAATNSEKNGSIGISVAIVVFGVVPDATSVPQTRQFATGVVSFPEVELGGDGTLIGNNPLVKESPPDSELMPAHYSGKNLQISVSVTEAGNIAGDFDKAAAETAAIKGALGPAVEAQVSKRYEDTD
ncbi:hypothetical protein ACIQU2_03860 [Pseudomonas sp. NPDC098740]|uniref:hypothetical protein n=1 Tax=Pseudomonas sp. NPDC098740 TaxID=3364486 RepID=UPI00383B8870